MSKVKSRKRKVVDKTKIAEKMTTYMMLMGYNGDYHMTVAKELNRRIWKRKERLGKRKIRRLHYLLCSVDSATLLAFTVSLGRLIWRDQLRAKQRNFERRLYEKIVERSVRKHVRRGKPRVVKAIKGFIVMAKKKCVVVPKVVLGFCLRPTLGSMFRMVLSHGVPRKDTKEAVIGGLIYRLAMAMNVLCYRNVRITTEWEFWTVYLVKKVCGLWRSVAIVDGLSDSLVSIAAKDFGFCLVSPEVLERMESCFACSSSAKYLGSRLAN